MRRCSALVWWAVAAVARASAAVAGRCLGSVTVGDDDDVADAVVVAATAGASACGDALGAGGQACGLSPSDAAAVAAAG